MSDIGEAIPVCLKGESIPAAVCLIPPQVDQRVGRGARGSDCPLCRHIRCHKPEYPRLGHRGVVNHVRASGKLKSHGLLTDLY